MKPLKIKRYIHDIQKDKLRSITTKKVNIKFLGYRLTALETELKQTLQKLAQYQTIIFTTSTSQATIQSNFSHLKQIKDYLIWIINQLNTHTNSEITSEQQKYITNIDSLLTTYTTENIDNIMTLRTRSGRSGEHIDVKNSCFDYGTYLESGLHHYRFLFQGSGLQFEPDELLTNLYQKKATFANYTTLAVFGCYNQYHYDNVQFQSIFKMVYGQACKLMYQSFDQVGFDTLRMLMLCNEMACNEGDIKVTRKLFPIAVRMAYALQLDQVHLSQLEMSSESESELIIKKWKVWNSMIIFYFTNQEFLMDKCLNIRLSEYNLKLNSLYQLNNQYINDLNYNASLVRLHIQEMLLIICSDIDHELTAQYNLNQKNYNIERIQIILSNYFIPSVNYLDYQLKLKYKVKNLDNCLCRFKDTTVDSLIYYHSIKNSLLIYMIQIYIITPGIITAPTPDFITNKNLSKYTPFI
ncbi:hypothetical protein K502DRAFT_329100 [Neoconidiobolus thromboides FSU 785]|nr:hypothetical protein K502DRAFT_329100 [Neoconidiobolus thromboides FSU 785]